MSLKKVDVLLVGAGVMSATLGKLLAQLDPSLKIMMVERLSKVAHESSHGLNNAGTGHAGYCELNYTPQQPDGSVDISRALAINAAYEVSRAILVLSGRAGRIARSREVHQPDLSPEFCLGRAECGFSAQTV